jgi:succinyl-diaminopimelate desuccinylase
MTSPSEALAIAEGLIRCRSVTPAEGGALDFLQARLEAAGFRCTRLPFSGEGTPDVDNLYARIGEGAPHLCFAGHCDVVPPGDEAKWSVPPFAGEVRDGMLWGRGAADMKGGIACFAAAAIDHAARNGMATGSISLLITGDEEGPAVNGTVKMLKWLAGHGEVPDHCIVGEPTNPRALGDMIKIGRRGSLTATLTVRGTQGHVAYPHLAKNPIPPLVAMLAALTARPLDGGTEHFQPSNLEVTTVDVGNPADNVIPAEARAVFNIRFNTLHSADSLMAWIRETCAGVGADHELAFKASGDCFLTEPGDFTRLVSAAVEAATGRIPELSTSGGTSDARFIKDYCPVVEFGLVGETMHKVDERVAVADIERLTGIYARILDAYFGTG